MEARDEAAAGDGGPVRTDARLPHGPLAGDGDGEQRRVPPERMAAWMAALEALGKAQRRLARVQAELIDDFDVTGQEQIMPDGRVVERPPEASG